MADLPSEPPPGLAEWQAWWKATGRDNLNRLLHEKWDPIGANVPLDEYSTYAGRVGRILRERGTDIEVMAALAEARTNMGLGPDPGTDGRIAALVVGWYAETGPRTASSDLA